MKALAPVALRSIDERAANGPLRTLFAWTFLIVSTWTAGSAYANLDVSIGAGFLRSAQTVKVGSTESSFLGWGGMAVGGLRLPFSNSLGFRLEGEYGRFEGLNNLQTTTYMERMTNNFISAKAAFYIEDLALGAGIRQNQLDIDSVSQGSPGLRSSYKGMSQFVFAQANLPMKKLFKTTIEGQYHQGSFSGIQFTDVQLSLRISMSPF